MRAHRSLPCLPVTVVILGSRPASPVSVVSSFNEDRTRSGGQDVPYLVSSFRHTAGNNFNAQKCRSGKTCAKLFQPGSVLFFCLFFLKGCRIQLAGSWIRGWVLDTWLVLSPYVCMYVLRMYVGMYVLVTNDIMVSLFIYIQTK